MLFRIIFSFSSHGPPVSTRKSFSANNLVASQLRKVIDLSMATGVANSPGRRLKSALTSYEGFRDFVSAAAEGLCGKAMQELNCGLDIGNDLIGEPAAFSIGVGVLPEFNQQKEPATRG
jgi:hypothetical protein